jgi:hypothetical protein
LINQPNPGGIDSYNNSSITSPALSNTTGTVYVGSVETLRLADNPVQLQNGNLSGGNWSVDDTGLLIIPGDISQITTVPGAAYATVVAVGGRGAIEDTPTMRWRRSLVGSNAMLSLVYSASLIVNQGLTSQGVVTVGAGGSGNSLTVNTTSHKNREPRRESAARSPPAQSLSNQDRRSRETEPSRVR